MKLLLPIMLLLAGCNSPLPTITTAPSHTNEPPCSLYAFSKTGAIIKQASIDPQVIGTPGQQESKPDAYAAFWTCLSLVNEQRAMWCECKRTNNKPFEDTMSKMHPMQITWLDMK